MDRTLEEAAYAGDVERLRQLLKENRMLLHQLAVASVSPANNPLHIAATLGHAGFVKEILTAKPELARSPNQEGLTPLHLASSHGHVQVVQEFLRCPLAAELCQLRDNDGLLPVHSAAVNGQVEVLQELIRATPETRLAQTSQGDSILHFAVKGNRAETVNFLIENTDDHDELLNLKFTDEIVNMKDEKGNTPLHLAVAARQFEIVKLLLEQEEVIDVNAENLRGSTPLDVLLELPQRQGDLRLGELIYDAGGRTTTTTIRSNDRQLPADSKQLVAVGRTQDGSSKSTLPRRPAGGGRMSNHLHIGKVEFGVPIRLHLSGTESTLILMATIIATSTFGAALNPPGGLRDGKAALNASLKPFLVFDTIAFVCSISVMLTILCLNGHKSKIYKVALYVVFWTAIYSTALAFTAAINRIYNHRIFSHVVLYSWILVPAVVFIALALILIATFREQLRGHHYSDALSRLLLGLIVFVLIPFVFWFGVYLHFAVSDIY